MAIIEQEHAWNAEKQIRCSLLYRPQLFTLQGNVHCLASRLSPMTEGSAAFERSFLSLLLGPVPRRMPIMVSCNASGSSSDGVSGNESEDDFDYVYELDKQNED